MFTVASIIALALASSVFAQPSPLTPAAAQEGTDCVITWVPDATGKWTDTNIQLMTGDNNDMVPLTTVTTIDTTSGAPATFTWTCPDITVYSAIYFYQFSHASEPSNLIWTTRWAIEGAGGSIVPPPNATQPDAAHSAVPWGVGALQNPGIAKPAPAYITGQSAAGGSTVPAATGSVTASGSSSMTMTMSSQTSSMTKMATTTGSKASTSSASAASTATAGAASSGAGLSRSQGSVVAAGVGAVFAGVFALF